MCYDGPPSGLHVVDVPAMGDSKPARRGTFAAWRPRRRGRQNQSARCWRGDNQPTTAEHCDAPSSCMDGTLSTLEGGGGVVLMHGQNFKYMGGGGGPVVPTS